MVKFQFLLTLIYSFSIQFALGQTNTELIKTILNFVNDSDLSNASISVTILDASNGSSIANYNSNLSLIPASSMKVVTTSTALGILSPNFTFKTALQYDGFLDSSTGILNGNLFLKGYGDPTLGSEKSLGVPNLLGLMNIFGNKVDSNNICAINGRVIGDGSYFEGLDAIGTDWQWEDIGNYYGAGAYGLNIHENYYYLNFQQNPNIASTPKILGTSPYVPDIYFTNKVISAQSGSGDNTSVFTAPLGDESIIRGTIPIGNGIFKVKGAISDPPYTAASYLHNILRNQYKTTIKKTPTNITDLASPPQNERKTLYTHQSLPLSRIIEEANIESNNLYVESILRTIAKEQNQEGTPKKGCEIITNYWKERGLDMNGFFMVDGSGLSARNGVTTRQLTGILYLVNKDPNISTFFYNSLPKAGETGTLKNMFKGTKAVGRIRAKSGSMTRVRSYTGYIEQRNGTRWCFSIIVNNYNCSSSEMRKKMENLMISFCD